MLPLLLPPHLLLMPLLLPPHLLLTLLLLPPHLLLTLLLLPPHLLKKRSNRFFELAIKKPTRVGFFIEFFGTQYPPKR
ncbi:hypothetical protein GALL_312400 [mine drainage metagenome]|uniref:Uncharacterized protein n=1 Tax=mine drainage metagenome TaxID=410659 RepID=A0A1J5R4K2_9ZZZZ